MKDSICRIICLFIGFGFIYHVVPEPITIEKFVCVTIGGVILALCPVIFDNYE